MNWLDIILPGDPVSVNHAYVPRKYGPGLAMTSAGKRWKREAIAITRRCAEAHKHRWRVEAGDALVIHIELIASWFFKNGKPRRSDCGNYSKLIVDAVCEGLGVDDRWVWKETVEKRDLGAAAADGQPRVLVTVETRRLEPEVVARRRLVTDALRWSKRKKGAAP